MSFDLYGLNHRPFFITFLIQQNFSNMLRSKVKVTYKNVLSFMSFQNLLKRNRQIIFEFYRL